MSATPSLADPVSHEEISRITAGSHHDPHAVLGAHQFLDGVIIRALRPLAESVTVVLGDGRRFPMYHVHDGVFSVFLRQTGIPDYRLADRSRLPRRTAPPAPRRSPTTRTGTCPRWARSTCT
jgi:hypothetical protein